MRNILVVMLLSPLCLLLSSESEKLLLFLITFSALSGFLPFRFSDLLPQGSASHIPCIMAMEPEDCKKGTKRLHNH